MAVHYIFEEEKSRIRETMNLSTDADHRTDILFGGDGKKEKRKKKKRKKKKFDT